MRPPTTSPSASTTSSIATLPAAATCAAVKSWPLTSRGRMTRVPRSPRVKLPAPGLANRTFQPLGRHSNRAEGGWLVALRALGLLLRSRWALLPAAAAAARVALRTALADALLRRELPGYREYAEPVRRRLVPGAW